MKTPSMEPEEPKTNRGTILVLLSCMGITISGVIMTCLLELYLYTRLSKRFGPTNRDKARRALHGRPKHHTFARKRSLLSQARKEIHQLKEQLKSQSSNKSNG